MHQKNKCNFKSLCSFQGKGVKAIYTNALWMHHRGTENTWSKVTQISILKLCTDKPVFITEGIKGIEWNYMRLTMYFKMLTKCSMLLTVFHETFLCVCVRAGSASGQRSLLLWFLTSLQLFSVISVTCRSFSTQSLSQGAVGRITFLLLPSHRFCPHPTLHWPFSSL